MACSWTWLADEGSTGGGLGQVLLIIAVVGGVSLLALVMTRRRFARRSAGAPARRREAGDPSGVSRDGGQRRLQQSMQALLLELEDLSREINSQVDTRLRALNLLVQEADEKIKELRRLQGLPEGEGPVPRRMPPPRQEPHPEVTSERYARVYSLAEKGYSVVEIATEMEMMTGEVELILALRRTAPPAAEDQA